MRLAAHRRVHRTPAALVGWGVHSSPLALSLPTSHLHCMHAVCVCMPHVLQDRARRSLQETLNAIKCQEFGVYVQASTLGSLEALVEFLNQSKIPVRAEGQHGGCTGSGLCSPLCCSTLHCSTLE